MTDQEASNLETVRTLVNEMIAAVGDSATREREVYPGWRVIDVLGHIVFWHRSYAANLGGGSDRRYFGDDCRISTARAWNSVGS